MLILFLAISAVVYFASDYEFASVSQPEPEAPIAAPPSDIDASTLVVVCSACHTTDGSEGIGPTWLGLAGSERTFEDGSTAVADSAYIKNSIVDPRAQIVAGFAPVMPEVYSDIFSDAEIDAIVTYIESLGG